tara:strand:+ start:262 stop:504 length:243 start_codon:yes stop_codon:yes gene_type:complete
MRWLKLSSNRITDLLAIAAIISAVAAVAVAASDNYADAYRHGLTDMCAQMTARKGVLNDFQCQVELNGEFITPRLEIRDK